MSIRRIMAGAAAAAGMATAALGMAAPASASEGDGVIQSGEFIVWRDCNLNGPGFDFATVHANYSDIYYINSVELVDNTISSAYNASNVNSVNAFLNPGFTGPRFIVLPLSRATMCNTGFNDGISSHTF